MTLHFTVRTAAPIPLKQFLRKQEGVSQRLLCRLKQCGGISCNGHPIRTIDPVTAGDVICLTLPEESGLTPNPALSVPIVFETEDYLLYDKPAGMPVHPSPGHYTDTLGNAFSAQFPSHAFRPVNRLDRDTTGLCLVAKHAACAAALQYQIQKTYYAAVCGSITESGTICTPIGRCPDSILKRCVTPDGKPAVTHYTPLFREDAYTFLRITLETGRTHQIRVHLASIGHPLAGDSLYGGTLTDCSRHALHCGSMQFPDRFRSAWMTVRCPLPPDFTALFPTHL